ncbi:hypothetical protein [Thalassomonas sp. RHCl1]|uniref:hypothetical protein n=1 Tax=Thalassomonas sp. RHCl1 TaxID=2995320 RepID=UPI00248CD961|nr:hypothetical protein [Thalassomonas sp. RHCl1]
MNKPLQIEQFEWSQSQPISQQLPYTFTNGLVFNGLNGQCGNCGQLIRPDDIHGSISTLSAERCLMVAKGYCYYCDTLTCFNFIIDQEGQAQVVDIEKSTAAHNCTKPN